MTRSSVCSQHVRHHVGEEDNEERREVEPDALVSDFQDQEEESATNVCAGSDLRLKLLIDRMPIV